MGFRRTIRRWFGGRYKQMSKGEVRDLDRKITAEMRAGTFSAVRRGGAAHPTGDQLWKADVVETTDEPSPLGDRLASLSSMSMRRPPTSVSQVSRPNNRYYYDDYYDDDYGGYQDGLGGGGYGNGFGGGGGGGGSSGDSGYAAGYYERPPPLIPRSSSPSPQQPGAWYVPGGGPFDMVEAKPESIYGGRGGGSRANSMMSTATRASRRPSAMQQPGQGNGYYTPPGRPPRPMGGNRAYSMQSDPGRMVYARSPQPRRPYITAAPSWDGHYYDDGGEVDPGYGRGGGRGGGYGGYRGWAGEDIGEHEYPLDNNGFFEEYHHPGS